VPTDNYYQESDCLISKPNFLIPKGKSIGLFKIILNKLAFVVRRM
jgi:hypothetical protein